MHTYFWLLNTDCEQSSLSPNVIKGIKILLFHESYQKRHDLICGFSSFLLSFSIYCLQCSSRFFFWIALYILTIQNNKQDTQHIERHFLGCIRSSFRNQLFILFLSQLKMFLAFVTFNFGKNKLFSIQYFLFKKWAQDVLFQMWLMILRF